MRAAEGDEWQRRSGCFAGEAARARRRRWSGRGGGRSRGPSNLRGRTAVRSRRTQRGADAGAGRRPASDFGGEAAGVRSPARRGGVGAAFAGAGAAPCRVELLRRGAGLPVPVHPRCREAGGVAARPGLLHLCRPGQRAALRLPLSAGDRPHRAVRARRRCGAGELVPSVSSSSQVPTRSGPRPPRECADGSPARSGLAVDPVERGRTVGSHAAIDGAEA